MANLWWSGTGLYTAQVGSDYTYWFTDAGLTTEATALPVSGDTIKGWTGVALLPAGTTSWLGITIDNGVSAVVSSDLGGSLSIGVSTVFGAAASVVYTAPALPAVTDVRSGVNYGNAQTGTLSAFTSTLSDSIIRNLEGRTDLDDQITDAIADACEELSGYRWRELAERDETLTTTSGVYYVTLPSDVDELLKVNLWCDVPATATTPAGRQYRSLELWSEAHKEARHHISSSSTSEPIACYREGSKLYFVPGPNSEWTVQLIYRAFLTMSSGSTNVEGFGPLIVAYATAQVYESLEHGKETASRWWSIYNRRLQRKQRSQETTGEVHRADLRIHHNEFRGYKTTFSVPGRSW